MNFSDCAFVLHSRPLRETSQIISFFSRESGRFSAVCRAGKGKSARGVAVQPFSLLQIGCTGKTDLKTLVSSEPLETRVIQGNNLYVGLYLNELLMRLVHEHESHPQLFDHYSFLTRKLVTEADIEPLLRMFEFTLLQDIGYGFALDMDSSTGEPVEPAKDYVLEQGEGMRLAGAKDSPGISISGQHLQAMAIGDFSDPGVRKAAKQLARLALSPHLGDKPLMSRELFRGSVASTRVWQ